MCKLFVFDGNTSYHITVCKKKKKKKHLKSINHKNKNRKYEDFYTEGTKSCLTPVDFLFSFLHYQVERFLESNFTVASCFSFLDFVYFCAFLSNMDFIS